MLAVMTLSKSMAFAFTAVSFASPPYSSACCSRKYRAMRTTCRLRASRMANFRMRFAVMGYRDASMSSSVREM